MTFNRATSTLLEREMATEIRQLKHELEYYKNLVDSHSTIKPIHEDPTLIDQGPRIEEVRLPIATKGQWLREQYAYHVMVTSYVPDRRFEVGYAISELEILSRQDLLHLFEHHLTCTMADLYRRVK